MKTLTRVSALFLISAFAATAFAAEGGEGEGRMMKKKGGFKDVDTACMQTAVETRDNAIIAAFDAFHVAGSAALTTRRDALKAAWGLADAAGRKEALKAAWTAYKDAVKSARQTLKQARKAAWQQCKTAAKVCKGSVGDETQSGGSEGADQQL